MQKIFIIEDTLELSKLYERAFRLYGFDVELSGNGGESLTRLSEMECPPSVILLDVMIPEVNGIDVLRKLKQDEKLKSIPVIIITNSLVAANEQLLLSLGAYAYFTKMEHDAKFIVEKVRECLLQLDESACASEEHKVNLSN